MKQLMIFFLGLYASTLHAGSQNTTCELMNEASQPCLYYMNATPFTLNAHGHVAINNQNLSIKLPEGFQVEKMLDSEIVGNVAYLSLSLSDSEAGATIIAAINIDQAKLNWQADFKTFNASPLLIVDDAIYIGGFNMVAKFDAMSGTLLWQHDNLYERKTQAFNAFTQAYIVNNQVIFPERKTSIANYSGIRAVIADKLSGKIISDK